jgi:hypothetical protein
MNPSVVPVGQASALPINLPSHHRPVMVMRNCHYEAMISKEAK